MSALWSYPDCLMTSGDIQYGVPTNVFCASVGDSRLAHLFGHGRCELTRDAKVCQFDVSIGSEQYIGGSYLAYYTT